MSAVRATVRLQLHAGFTLVDAAAQLDYYAALGISHMYLSPIARAVPGSSHGYDGVDPRCVSRELGGEPALRALAAQARQHGIGLILDIVPNHMAAHADNAWWWDVLQHGRDSAHARWFDINWAAPGCDGRIVLPILDRPLDAALDAGVLQLAVHEGQPVLMHHDTRLPLAPGAPGMQGDLAQCCAALNARAGSADPAWRALLDAQAYAPVWWRLGDDRINYRRFFTIASLVALQVDRDDVFEAVHRLPLRLLAEGVVDGLRVDHVDGLTDPRGYLQRLRGAMAEATAGRPGRPLLWVEKILAPDEKVPGDWQCDGTTGYDFMDQVSAWLHDAAGQAALIAHWRQASGRSGDFDEEERCARDEVLARGLRSEFEAALTVLARLDRTLHAPGARLGRPLLARALTALLRRFPVYRSYAAGDQAGPDDRRRWADVLAGVEASSTADTALAARVINDWFWRDGQDARAVRRRDRLRQRFQQLSAPLNAKAVEDRTFYRHGVLLSRNEVGSRPDHFALSSAQFHASVRARAMRHPHALLATATHDHKRGEDSRARLAVLSERPQWWARQTRMLDHGARQLGVALPPAGLRQMLWQSVLGAWPMQPPAALDAFAARIVQWQIKALREADEHSSWADPDPAVETQLSGFIEAALLSPRGAALRERLQQAVEGVELAGVRNALAQVTLRLTLPGIPDLYQGTEGWDLSLVDPDNRAPVDHAQRRAWLDDPRAWPQLLLQWRDGALKARLVQRLLQLRAALPALFAGGDYQPLEPDREVPMLAFTRHHAGSRIVVLTARHTRRSPASLGAGLADSHWRGALLAVPAGRYRNLLTGVVLQSDGSPERLRDLVGGSPVAIYSSC